MTTLLKTNVINALTTLLETNVINAMTTLLETNVINGLGYVTAGTNFMKGQAC